MENALKSWKPSRQLGSAGGKSVWQADPQPAYSALEGRFSGGKDYIDGWSSWDQWTAGKRDRLEKERATKKKD